MKQLFPALLMIAAGLYLGLSNIRTSDQSITLSKEIKQAENISEVPQGILTTWKTGAKGNGRLTLYAGKRNGLVDGFFYNSDTNQLNGMVSLKYRNRRLNGVWFQPNSRIECKSKMHGTYYWGEVEFMMSRNSFAGKWGYCENPKTEVWNGEL